MRRRSLFVGLAGLFAAPKVAPPVVAGADIAADGLMLFVPDNIRPTDAAIQAAMRQAKANALEDLRSAINRAAAAAAARAVGRRHPVTGADAALPEPGYTASSGEAGPFLASPDLRLPTARRSDASAGASAAGGNASPAVSVSRETNLSNEALVAPTSGDRPNSSSIESSVAGVSNPMVDALAPFPQRNGAGAELRAVGIPSLVAGARAAEGATSSPSAAHQVSADCPHAGIVAGGESSVIWNPST